MVVLRYIIYFQDGWFLGEVHANCNDTCKINSRICTVEAFHSHNDEVDSSDEVLSIIQKLGGTTSATSCAQNDVAKAVPLYNSEGCTYSSLSVAEFDCEKDPAPINLNRRRLCWCHAYGKSMTILRLGW